MGVLLGCVTVGLSVPASWLVADEDGSTGIASGPVKVFLDSARHHLTHSVPDERGFQ